MNLDFKTEILYNPALRASLFASARTVDPHIAGYTGTDDRGYHHMQAIDPSTGAPYIVVVKIVTTAIRVRAEEK
jgi:hypothetical protein